MAESKSEYDETYDPAKRRDDAAGLLANIRAKIGKPQCAAMCQKYILDKVDDENNDFFSLIIAKLLLDDNNYFSFMLLGVQKEKIITNDDLQMLNNLLSKFNKETRDFYEPIIPILVGKVFDTNKLKLYAQIKTELLEYYALNLSN
jgi:hypothetical protein